MKPCVSIDDVSHLLTYTGNLFPKIAGGKFKKGLADKSHIPIMFEPMAMNDATAKKVYRNRPLSDLKASAMRFNSKGVTSHPQQANSSAKTCFFLN